MVALYWGGARPLDRGAPLRGGDCRMLSEAAEGGARLATASEMSSAAYT